MIYFMQTAVFVITYTLLLPGHSKTESENHPHPGGMQ